MQDMRDQNPPQGYPVAEQVSEQPGQEDKKKKKPRFFETKKKGDRGFIEGCLFALCCCWICEMCF
ncbi:unnamed protein product [Arabidopsis lyrata]|uniref:Cysteine-rich transmembrane domain-containing protein n=2 Tax=Arabidopsis TaxID=3701 RepID=D7LXF5_ARALL|nr:cysteine-rich and transmembrane domain-containing protein A isoform X1 [Arabidopsis lyrata subsp. lyrata]EFH47334.1 hypothetical protein ARALYDRAFT_908293 [Arabidopsis lyrata subsp. lyrata]KAG7549428.1 Cysteine-rich transmembrane CYSTM domain [Arabidopsis thaliana x Arabidopsis arenosa]CAH8269985.1 unnamed protein product [Arabidopsis lyrata]|eukprot:XP_002871075.1 cysteine-rich and transmembrane domain-containing protein A isoform X1 [Arabidopsis lyrata subsp. lyrata]